MELTTVKLKSGGIVSLQLNTTTGAKQWFTKTRCSEFSLGENRAVPFCFVGNLKKLAIEQGAKESIFKVFEKEPKKQTSGTTRTKKVIAPFTLDDFDMDIDF